MDEMEVGTLKTDELWGKIIRLSNVLMGKVLRLVDIEVTTNLVDLEHH
jgi:hypothetical protein